MFIFQMMRYEVPTQESYTYLEVTIAQDIKNSLYYRDGPLYIPENISIYHKSKTIDALLSS